MTKQTVFSRWGLESWTVDDNGKTAVYVPNDDAHKELSRDLWHTAGISPATYFDNHGRVEGWHFTGQELVLEQIIQEALKAENAKCGPIGG